MTFEFEFSILTELDESEYIIIIRKLYGPTIFLLLVVPFCQNTRDTPLNSIYIIIKYYNTFASYPRYKTKYFTSLRYGIKQ